MTPEARWQAFHTAHPDFYDRLQSLAFVVHARGHKRYSIAMLFEQLRVTDWHAPNACRAYYARKLMKEHPQLAGFFRIAPLRQDSEVYRQGYRQGVKDAAALVEDWDTNVSILELLAVFDVFRRD